MPIANPIFAIICSFHHTKKGGKKPQAFSPSYCASGFNLLKSAPSLNNFYAHFFDQFILWPPGHTIPTGSKIYKGCYTPPCLYWFSFGFEVKWAKVRGGYVNLLQHAMKKI
jgi:hypothetical protein